jgi:hypothetical protein
VALSISFQVTSEVGDSTWAKQRERFTKSCCRNVEELVLKLHPTRIGDDGWAVNRSLSAARTKRPTSDVTWKMIDMTAGNLSFC